MQAVDPYFQDIPWDIIKDDNGRVIGEVYRILSTPPPRRRQNKCHTTSTIPLKNTQLQKR